MSYSFYVRSPEVDFGVLDTWRAPLVVEESEGGVLEGPFEDGQVVHVFEEGVTTRSVEISWENGTFQARVMTMACPDDYRIALHLACEVARRAGVEVESEEGERFAPDAVDAHYGDDWIRQHVRSLFGSTVAILREHGEIMMSGAGCTVTLNQAVLDEVLAASDDPEAQAEALFRVFREVSFPGEEWYRASLMAVRLQDGSERTLIVWGPGVSYQFPKAELIALTDPQIFVPWTRLAELAGDRLTWIDGATARVEAIPDEEWDAFVARAMPYATTLEGFGPGGGEAEAHAEPDGPAVPGEGNGITWLVTVVVVIAVLAGLAWLVM